MTICPVALAAGCKKCPVFSVCPLKSVLGDYEKPDSKQSKSRSETPRGGKDKN